MNDLSTGNLSSIISQVNQVVSIALGLVTTGVVILAIFIAFKFFTAEDEGKRKNAKQQLIYAIIGVIVMIALIALAPNLTKAITGAIK